MSERPARPRRSRSRRPSSGSIRSRIRTTPAPGSATNSPAFLHREPSPTRRTITARHVDWPQPATSSTEIYRCRLQDRHGRVARTKRPQQGPPRRALPEVRLACIEGDTPAFLSLMDNGLVAYMNPTFGGMGRAGPGVQPWLESRPYWTNGRTSRDTVVGTDKKSYTSDQATIWRWRQAYMHDFAARMAWTVSEPTATNHNPQVTVNAIPGKAPVMVDAKGPHADQAGCLCQQRSRSPCASLRVAVLSRSWHQSSIGDRTRPRTTSRGA